MTYTKGNKVIAIQMDPYFRRVKPELYIGEGNQLTKVANFRNKENAEKFEEMLQYFFGNNLVKEKQEE